MAAESRREPDAVAAGVSSHDRDRERTVEERLFTEGYAFDVFQAVRILHRLRPERPRIGGLGPPSAEPVRFRALNSLSFPPSAIHDLARPGSPDAPCCLVQSFLGLTGPSGILPRHYTELLMRLERERRDLERYTLRDWLDLFNHRLCSLFFRAWEKYRPAMGYERWGGSSTDPDGFTFALLCLVGLGHDSLRGRLRVTATRRVGMTTRREALAGVDDLGLLRYAGLLAHRPRSAVSLEALLRDYFALEVEVRQFQGQWLLLDRASQTRLGDDSGNNNLGYNALVGERVWDVQSKFLVRLGPLTYRQFSEFLPDQAPDTRRKAAFVLGHLVRFFVGPGLDFDVQLVLRASEVPDFPLPGAGQDGPALGWNTWLHSEPLADDPCDAVFAGAEAVSVGSDESD
jgi:type VI secretion system protein ImpH